MLKAALARLLKPDYIPEEVWGDMLRLQRDLAFQAMLAEALWHGGIVSSIMAMLWIAMGTSAQNIAYAVLWMAIAFILVVIGSYIRHNIMKMFIECYRRLLIMNNLLSLLDREEKEAKVGNPNGYM